jgi:methionyl-tRNA formyltransferase
MRTVFMGTPAFALPTLEKILGSRHEILAVFTQPDRPGGRGRRLIVPPVKEFALERGLEVIQPKGMASKKTLRLVTEMRPDIIVSAAFGRILKPVLLDLPPRGGINLHPSLLPALRGAAPIQRAILEGLGKTGVTIYQMDEGMDTGDIFLQRAIAIDPDENAVELAQRLSMEGAELVVETLDRLEEGSLAPEPQDHSLATLAPKLEKEEGFTDFKDSPDKLCRKWRAFQPWPGLFSFIKEKRVKLREIRVAEGKTSEPGVATEIRGDSLLVSSGGGFVEIISLQPEGKKPMTGQEFVNGRYIALGTSFDDRQPGPDSPTPDP